MIDLNAALCHHLFELPIADWIGYIPSNAPQDDVALELAAFEIDHVAAPVDCSRSAYVLSARYQSLRQNPNKSKSSRECSVKEGRPAKDSKDPSQSISRSSAATVVVPRSAARSVSAAIGWKPD